MTKRIFLQISSFSTYFLRATQKFSKFQFLGGGVKIFDFRGEVKIMGYFLEWSILVLNWRLPGSMVPFRHEVWLYLPAGSKLISFDIKSTFTTIPDNIAEELMADICLRKGIDPEVDGGSICLKHNLCVFK